MDIFLYWLRDNLPNIYEDGMSFGEAVMAFKNYLENTLHLTNKIGDKDASDPRYGYVNLTFDELLEAYNLIMSAGYNAELNDGVVFDSQREQINASVNRFTAIITPLWPSIINNDNFRAMIFSCI